MARVKEHVYFWSETETSLDQVSITRLSGMSNACYRVALNESVVVSDPNRARVYLYRHFSSKLTNDKKIEETFFRCMSDKGLGAKFVF